MSAQTISAIVAITNRINRIKGHRAVLSQPFILRHGIFATEFYIDGKDHAIYFIDIAGYTFALSHQSEFVQQRVADMLAATPLAELRNNLRAVNFEALQALEVSEYMEYEEMDANTARQMFFAKLAREHSDY